MISRALRTLFLCSAFAARRLVPNVIFSQRGPGQICNDARVAAFEQTIIKLFQVLSDTSLQLSRETRASRARFRPYNRVCGRA
jgi:hypothetical protein